ncbi:MAG: archaemetzincin [Planctomycetes bacterium]|jgi:archaemetzincin|nr:archaemetzincin [Planctomycetota bacterium]
MRSWTLVILLLPLGGCPSERPAASPFDDTGFRRLPPPGPSDWLAVHEESGMDFDAYVASNPLRAGEDGTFLAILPVGPFGPEERQVLDRSAEFCASWFDLPVRTLPGEPLPGDGWHRDRPWGRQYRTDYFLRRLLPRLLPEDAVALFGVTMADLYPDDSWNFVFGQASYRGGVAVWSFLRYFAAFDGQPDTAGTRRLALLRAVKLVVHEAGHVFGLPHCIEYECVMNGSNSLDEADGRPLALCPPCLRKLAWNRGFDILARYSRLAALAGTCGLAAEADWFAARAAALRPR